jgi:hypothetical protein
MRHSKRMANNANSPGHISARSFVANATSLLLLQCAGDLRRYGLKRTHEICI